MDTHPELEQYWADEERSFVEFTASNAYVARWRCRHCGGIINVAIKDFIDDNYECSYCNGKKALYPRIGPKR